jgi:hypothetical protein
MDIDDKLNEYYRFKKRYIKNKQKCINCNRNVGSKFITENWDNKRVYKIKCGDNDKPCDLNKEIIIIKDNDTKENLHLLKNTKDDLELKILKLKNEKLFFLDNDDQIDEKIKKLTNLYNNVTKKYSTIFDKLTSKSNTYKEALVELMDVVNQNSEIEDTTDRITHLLKTVKPISIKMKSFLELHQINDYEYKLHINY